MATYFWNNTTGQLGGGNGYYGAVLTINETSYDVDTNTSIVNFKFIITRGIKSVSSTGVITYDNNKADGRAKELQDEGQYWSIWYKVKGVDSSWKNVSVNNYFTYNFDGAASNYTVTLLSSKDLVIPHNDDGTCTITVRGYVYGGSKTTLGAWYTPNSSGGDVILTSIPRDPLIRLKESGTWKQGKPWIKTNGAWVKGKKVYVKDGVWKETPLKG